MSVVHFQALFLFNTREINKLSISFDCIYIYDKKFLWMYFSKLELRTQMHLIIFKRQKFNKTLFCLNMKLKISISKICFSKHIPELGFLFNKN